MIFQNPRKSEPNLRIYESTYNGHTFIDINQKYVQLKEKSKVLLVYLVCIWQISIHFTKCIRRNISMIIILFCNALGLRKNKRTISPSYYVKDVKERKPTNLVFKLNVLNFDQAFSKKTTKHDIQRITAFVTISYIFRMWMKMGAMDWCVCVCVFEGIALN